MRVGTEALRVVGFQDRKGNVSHISRVGQVLLRVG